MGKINQLYSLEKKKLMADRRTYSDLDRYGRMSLQLIFSHFDELMWLVGSFIDI